MKIIDPVDTILGNNSYICSGSRTVVSLAEWISYPERQEESPGNTEHHIS